MVCDEDFNQLKKGDMVQCEISRNMKEDRPESGNFNEYIKTLYHVYKEGIYIGLIERKYFLHLSEFRDKRINEILNDV